MKRNHELFDRNYEEYISFINTFQKFPNKNSPKSSSGISLYLWRNNVKHGFYGKENQQMLIDFDNKMSKGFRKVRDAKRKESDTQKFYDTITEPRHPWEPSTLKEYLDNDNRYKHFTVATYISIMLKFGMYDKKCAIIAFLNNVDPDRPLSMRAFGKRFGFGDLESKPIPVLETLTVREQLVIRRRYGIDDLIPITLRETGSVLGVGQERARQIEAKAHRKLRHPSRLRKLVLPKGSIIMNTNYENHTFIFIEEIPDLYHGYRNTSRCDQKVLGTAQYPIDELDEAIRDSGMGINSLAVRSINTFFEYKSLVPRGTERILELVPTKNDDVVAYTEVIVRIKIDPSLEIEKEKEKVARARRSSAKTYPNSPSRQVMFGQLHGDYDGEPLTLSTVMKRYLYPPDAKPF